MSELVAECPRCGAQNITFDVLSESLLYKKHDWQRWYEAFCVCRKCHKSTVFVLAQDSRETDNLLQHSGLAAVKATALNRYMRIEGFVSVKDRVTALPPEHVPPQIAQAFSEGATCIAVNCFNAAGTMFRLCVDIATRDLLPTEDVKGLNAKIRRDLGLRLPWLFDNGKLPEALRDLAHCIKEDGNDGAHAGTLDKEEAQDLQDFAVLLLERLYTEPARVAQAAVRRMERRRGKVEDQQ